MTTELAVIVENGVVNNRILVDVDEGNNVSFSLEGALIVRVPEDSIVSEGWSYVDGEFHPPVESAE